MQLFWYISISIIKKNIDIYINPAEFSAVLIKYLIKESFGFLWISQNLLAAINFLFYDHEKKKIIAIFHPLALIFFNDFCSL